MSTKATPVRMPLRQRPNTASSWKWSNIRRPNAALCCCRADGWWREASHGPPASAAWPETTNDSNKPWPACTTSLSPYSCSPNSAQTRAQPISQKAQAHVIDHPVGPAVMHGAHFQVALEFAEGFLHVQQPFVVSQDLLRRAALDGFIGVQQIPPVLLGFLGDNLFLAFPLQLAPGLDLIGKILVGFEPLQTAAYLDRKSVV